MLGIVIRRDKNLNKMQNIEKRKKQYFKTFIFRRVEFAPSITPLYVLIVLLNVVSDGLISFEYVISNNKEYINTGAQLIFYAQVGLISLFLIITAASVWSSLFRYIWLYYLLFLQSITIGFVRSAAISLSYNTAVLYDGSITMKVAQISVFIIFCLIIVVFKNNAYYPFQNVRHLFAMRQSNISLYLLAFRTALGLFIYGDIFSEKSDSYRAILIIAFLFFWKSREPGYLHQVSLKLWDCYYYFVNWTCMTFFFAYYFNLINDRANMKIFQHDLSFKQTVLYFWVYTFPFLIAMPIYHGKAVDGQFWKKIFEIYNHEVQNFYSKQLVYVICDQLHHFIEGLKKSELKFKDPCFKNLCDLIKKHNENCTFLDCNLNCLDQNKEQSDDQLHQHKKFLKILKVCLEFTRLALVKLKQKYPGVLQIQIQIAHFYLVALRNKQKGMILYNQHNTKNTKRVEVPPKQNQTQPSEASSEENGLEAKKTKTPAQEVNKNAQQSSFSQTFAIYFLKNKIDSIFVGEQKQATGNSDNELSEFRQKIQVSVTMLAQFWSLLADPKCNLKKMYELTNFLFPLKLSLEQDWQRIKLLKNIEIYTVYAKYLIKMFNDKENGMKIFEQAQKIDYDLKHREQIQLGDKGGQILQETGIIFMEYDGKNSGVMFQINVNAQNIFGYNKGELLNKKVNEIMPKMYADAHDRVLENYQQTNYSTMMNKQRHVWGKSKQGFLVPFTILIKPILSFYSQSSNSEVYANLKKQSHLRESIALIIDNNEIIHQYSSGALRVFPILVQKYENTVKSSSYKYGGVNKDSKAMDLTDINIKELLPNFNEIKEKVLVENDQYQLEITRSVKASRNGQEGFIQKCMYSVSITEITIKVTGKIGYLIKLMRMGTGQYQPLQKDCLQISSCTNKATIEAKKKSNEKENVPERPSLLRRESREKEKEANKVKFMINQQDELLSHNRKYIFSYDMADRHREFIQSSMKVQTQKDCVPADTTTQKKLEKSPSLYKDQDKIQMKYVGGYTNSSEIVNKIKSDTQSSFKAQLKVSQQKHQEQKVDYSVGIKTKRLTDNIVKEMREEEHQMEFKNGQDEEQKQGEQAQFISEIKPNELSIILSKSSKNRLITYLKIITIALLCISSGLAITQHVIMSQTQNKIHTEMSRVKYLSQIKTQMYSLNYYVNYLTLYTGKDLLTFQNFHNNIDELNERLNNFLFSVNSKLVYSDGSVDDYYLGFAMNKLISQANSLQLTNQGLLNSKDTSSFFIKYNTANGLAISIGNQAQKIWDDLMKIKQSLGTIGIIFIGVALGVSSLIIFAKNILLRMVIHKKAQILQVFFQIPRVSCSIIQKQCESFIVQLSLQNEDQQIGISSAEQQFERGNNNSNNKNVKVQKKRATVGQQNTQFTYCLVSLVFLAALVSFQMFTITMNQLNKTNITNITESAHKFYDIESKFFSTAVYMSSMQSNPSIPIQETGKNQMLAIIHKIFNDDIMELRACYYALTGILDEEFNKKANHLYYSSVCGAGQVCISETQQVPQQNSGLNSILSRYIQLLKSQYTSLTASPPNTPSQHTYLVTKGYQYSMKEHWRQLTQLITDSQKRYLAGNEMVSLWVLVVVCFLFLGVFMVGWIRYYWVLEEKIVATEYILAFIPIDEVNKNRKIAHYIRNQINSRK